MSRLIALRQRIKTATTIQKTTHAMQLTSMSAHARLQKKKEFIKTYKQSIKEIMQHMGLEPKESALDQSCIDQTCLNKNPFTKTGKQLIIIVGSQKGLCGAFNSRLMHLFEKNYPEKEKKRLPANTTLVCIGKKIAEHLERMKLMPTHSYPTFTALNFVDIAHELERLIFSETGSKAESYHTVTIYSNHPQTFFIQKSTITVMHRQLLQEQARLVSDEEQAAENAQDPYHYEQPLHELREKIQRIYFKACLEEILFNSLVAEQASRFIAMDSATRNAETILNDMQRDYNKLRQTSITRELTDLAGGIL